MRHTLSALLLGATIAHAADQTILGAKLLVKNPGTEAKRQVIGKAKEKSSPNTLVGDPTVGGATLTVSTDGATATGQTFALPQGTNRKGKPFWTGSTSAGFKYKDAAGENGPVKQVRIKKSRRGVFTIKFKALGKLGPLSIVPPDPGDGGCVLLELTGGDSYSVAFAPGDGTVRNKTGVFKVRKPTGEGTCVGTMTNLAGPAFPPVGGSADFAFVGDSADPGGAELSLFDFAPRSWTQLYWGPDSGSPPAAGLDGTPHLLSTFAGITGGNTVATWQGVTDWTDPSDMTTYTDVPIQLTITVTAGGVTWLPSGDIPGLDPGPGTGIGAVVNVAPAGTALDFTERFEFTADIPTDASGFVALSTIPQLGGGLTVTSFSGAFYSEP